jgi:plasmid stabilization system protein ParE
MKRKLISRPQAAIDIISHALYLIRHNPSTAARFESAVFEAIDKIEQDPRSGPTFVYPGLPDVELRFRRPKGFKNYLVVYQVTDDCIFVLRVLHASQDIESALRP